MKKNLLLAILLVLQSKHTYSQLNYPKTKIVAQTDDYFGTKVNDPYRWLEDDRSQETKAWVKEQNQLTFSYLDKIPFRNKIKERLTQLWNFEKMSTPFKKGENIFCFYNDGLKNQPVMMIQKSLKDKKQVFLDMNTYSADGTSSLSGFSFSGDNKYMAFGVSRAGSDWVEIHVMEVATKQELKDKIEWVKFSDIAWQGNGFYYSRYDTPKEGVYTQQNRFHKIYYHKVGTEQSKDQLVHQDLKHGERNFSASLIEDERFIFIYGSESTSGQNLMMKDLVNGSEWINLVDNFENEYGVVDNVGEEIYIRTNWKAPNFRLMKFNVNKPQQENWVEVISEQKDVLNGVYFVGDQIVCNYLRDVSSKLFVFDLNGKQIREIKLNGLCTVNGWNSSRKEKSAFYSVVSFTTPDNVYFYDGNVGTSKRIFFPIIPFKSEEYETKQVFYPSKDGTKIPMFITHKKGVTLNGSNPCFLFGYGGFQSHYAPEFRIDRTVFMEAGGIYCVANIRGGDEYGEAWHQAGIKCNKQNVFDDFIAAAEYLAKEKYTSHEKLAIHGRSNGGLLIGAVMTQRPDIAKVCIPTVGVLDMLRYHLFTIGRAWSVDYGLSENKNEFECLYKYSPLHNVKKNSYPATLVTTADHDDRVVPAHSFKFISTLQANQQGKNPTLIRIDENAGHGSGKPTTKQIEEFTDIWSFVFYNLGVEY
ncbi:MAG: prolyl oligopeptidase family serine peptidase [Bacteroidota bacterium]